MYINNDNYYIVRNNHREKGDHGETGITGPTGYNLINK